jgi:hypothetical protein
LDMGMRDIHIFLSTMNYFPSLIVSHSFPCSQFNSATFYDEFAQSI